MDSTTVVIKTIGRPTLHAAVESAKREGLKVLVVSDGCDLPLTGTDVITLGRKWGFYGGMAANVGAAIVDTEFITFLDDDDEFAVGAGDIIRAKLKENPEIDLWIGGVRFNEPIFLQGNNLPNFVGKELALNSERGLTVGNVAMPTYRASIFAKIPFRDLRADSPMTDYWHIKECEQAGAKIDWFGEVIYLVRPSGGINGRGK